MDEDDEMMMYEWTARPADWRDRAPAVYDPDDYETAQDFADPDDFSFPEWL